MLVDEEGDIGLRGHEAETVREEGEALVPRTWSLLQAVERLVKPAHMVWKTCVNKTWRLLTIDLLVQVAVEEGVLDVQLMDWPRTRDGDDEDDADRGRLHNGTKGLVEVHPMLL
jgi:hypothetical protein